MALTRFFFLTSLLLFPLLIVIVSANYDYPKYQEPDRKKQLYAGHDWNPEPDHHQVAENNGYVPKPNPVVEPEKEEEEEEKKKKNCSPKLKPEETKKSYGFEWNTKEDDEDNEKEKEKEKKGYGYGYGHGHGYGNEEGVEVSYEVSKHQEKEREVMSGIGFEGVILCKSGLKYFPIQGAVAKITCVLVDGYGKEKAPVSVSSCAADAKGYFFGKLSGYSDKLKIKECKGFVESSPLETCNVPCDVNRGITGALLSSYRSVSNKHMKFYSVGPFFFTPKPETHVPKRDGY